jgi:hypothetical protein
MTTITSNHKTIPQNNTATTKKVTANKSIIDRYLAFCDTQMKYRMVWFLLPALILPCLFMPLAMYTMLYLGSIGAGFSVYLFGSMSLLIAGLVANVGNLTTRVTISLFFAAVIWNIIFPMISLFMAA